MVPIGPLHRRTRRTMGRLTRGSGVDMKDESHKCCTSASKSLVHCLTPRACAVLYTTSSVLGQHGRNTSPLRGSGISPQHEACSPLTKGIRFSPGCTSAVPMKVFGHVVYSWTCKHL